MPKNKKNDIKQNFIEEHKTAVFITLFSIIAVMAIAIIVCVGIYNKMIASITLPFVPPEFDENAVEGNPEDEGIGEKQGYRILSDPSRLEYTAGICGLIDVNENNEADMYLYNPPTNRIWLKIRIYGKDPKTDIVAETGLIKPGEYVKTVSFRREIVDGEDLTIKLMSYVPDDYTSAGTAIVEPVVVSPIKPKGCLGSIGTSGLLVALAVPTCVPLVLRKRKK